MADTETKSDAKVVDALNDLYESCLTATEQIKRLKIHFKVRYRYCRLVEMFHEMLVCGCCHNVRDGHKGGECVSCWSMCVLHRIEGLGADARSSILGSVVITDAVKTALERVLQSLRGVYIDAGNAISAAKDDHPTAKIAGEIQCAADKHIECVKAHLRQIEDLGNDYLITLV